MENDLLKRKLNETKQQDNNVKDKVAIYSESDVHALRKPLYSSFFLSKIDDQVNNKANNARNVNNTDRNYQDQINKAPKTENQYASNESYQDKRLEKETKLNQASIFDISVEVARQLSTYKKEMNQQINSCHAEIVTLKTNNETLIKNMAKVSSDTIMLKEDIVLLKKEISNLLAIQMANHNENIKSHNLTALLISKLIKQITLNDI